MTHPNGATVYPPLASFRLQRSYIQTLRWSYNPALTFAQSGSEFHLGYPPIPGYAAHVKLKEGFWFWNSGSWYLRDVVEWCYETYPGDPVEHPAALVVVAGRDTELGLFVLELVTPAWSAIRYDDLPAQLPGYWTPPPYATP